MEKDIKVLISVTFLFFVLIIFLGYLLEVSRTDTFFQETIDKDIRYYENGERLIPENIINPRYIGYVKAHCNERYVIIQGDVFVEEHLLDKYCGD